MNFIAFDSVHKALNRLLHMINLAGKLKYLSALQIALFNLDFSHILIQTLHLNLQNIRNL